MPVTSFALLVCSAVAVAVIMVWAVSTWGVVTVLPVVILLALVGLWAMSPVPHDDGQA